MRHFWTAPLLLAINARSNESSDVLPVIEKTNDWQPVRLNQRRTAVWTRGAFLLAGSETYRLTPMNHGN